MTHYREKTDNVKKLKAYLAKIEKQQGNYAQAKPLQFINKV